jgi:hypothetical protein
MHRVQKGRNGDGQVVARRFASREFMKGIVDPMLVKRQRNDFICSERMRRLEAGKMRVELEEALAAKRGEMDS